MNRTPVRTKTIVGVLTQPDPRFVSLVDHGANQRPFHTVKRDRTAKEQDMPNDTLIHRIMFDPAQFADETAVKTWLISKGYTDFTVVQGDGHFYVEDNPADAFKGALRTVPHGSAKGVSFTAGDAKPAENVEDAAKGAAEDATTDADATNAAGSAEDAAKGSDTNTGTAAEDAAKGEAPADAAGAPGAQAEGSADGGDADGGQSVKSAVPTPRVRVRRGLTKIKGVSVAAMIAGHEGLAAKAVELGDGLTAKSFADMLENYNGSMPPGMYDAADAMMGELRKMFRNGDATDDTVAKLASDFTNAAMKMYTTYHEILDADGTATKAVGDEGEALLDAIFEMIFAEPAAKAAASPDVTALVAQIGELTSTMKSMQTRIDQLTFEAAEAEKAAKGTRTLGTRKSTDTNEVEVEAQKAVHTAKAEDRSRSARRMFGSHAAKRLAHADAGGARH